FGAAALRTFLGVLKIFVSAVIMIAMVDRAFGRLMTHDMFGSLLGVAPIADQYRMGVIRATATFDHAILLGTFCATVAAMLLYSEANIFRRIFWVVFCLVGIYLSLSSSSLMAFAIMLATYTYDRLTRGFSWRWPVCWIVCAAVVGAAMFTSNDPLGWIFSHMTL